MNAPEWGQRANVITQAAVEWGGGKGEELIWGWIYRIFSFTALLSLSPALSRRKPYLYFLTGFLGFVCVWAKQMFTSPSPHFWSTTSFQKLCRAHLQSQGHDSNTQPVDLWLPHADLPKHRAARMRLLLNTPPQMQLAFKFCTILRNLGKTKMACGLLKDWVEEMRNLTVMKWTVKSRDSLSSNSYFPCAPHFKS